MHTFKGTVCEKNTRNHKQNISKREPIFTRGFNGTQTCVLNDTLLPEMWESHSILGWG